jgi:peptidoglycan/xylan/chitin deacetylase (PgdA/CDA1 family)
MRKFKNIAIIIFFISIGTIFVFGEKAKAEVINSEPTAQVSFTFDDATLGTYTKAAPTLAQYGYSGTSYVTTNCVGKTTVPNNCPADSGLPYMTWAQLTQLQNSYGWEIGSHTVSHPLLTTVNTTKLRQELANSKTALTNRGFKVNSIATPYGDYNDAVLSEIAKYYTSHRGFADTGYNNWPHNNYLLRVQQVQSGVSIETVKSYIDQAQASNTWLILVFHDISDVPSSSPDDYQYSTSDLSSIAAYIKSKNIKVTNITNGMLNFAETDNKLTDPINGNAIGNGWSTDMPANVKVDTTSKGAFQNPVNSVKVTSSTTTNVHLYSPTITINANSKYAVKAYSNVQSKNGGQLGVYIDEYDASGNWISGQYKQTISEWHVNEISFAYFASSSKVAKARLQLIVTKSNGTIVYLDNIKWIETTTGPAPVPDPIFPNLIVNGGFENGFNNWTTDSSENIYVTSTNNNNALFMTGASTKSTHLFSSSVQVSSSKSYKLSLQVNVIALTQIGFYIDEYDASGNWISGQYLFTKTDNNSGLVSFSYKPTSFNVASSSLQVILYPSNSTQIYIDDVKLQETI